MSARDALRGWSKNDLEREVVRLRAEEQRLTALLSDQLASVPETGNEISVQGIVGSRDGKPIVSYRSGEVAWQSDPATARMHALQVLDAAVEAERDAATIAFLQSTGLETNEAGAFLHALREHRADWLPTLTDRASTEERPK